MSLIAELKRRNVFKVGTAYLALGWVITQVTATVVPYMRLPEWTVPMVLWIGAIGFPCVLIFSWLYELTPEGLKREAEVDRSQSITGETSRKLDYLIIGLLVLAIGLFGYGQWRGVPAVATSNAAGSGADRAQDSLPRDGARVRAQDTLPQPEAAPNARSIAVLPFVNMSSDKEQDYFSDGLSEELLNLLAKIPQLEVIARTSSFSFKGQTLEIPEIARRLQVANILEGSVRKSGNKLRITAQLVEASSGRHLWSETYDREIADVFTIQDEIAGAVVEQLKITLLGEAPRVRTVDPKAYALYLQARALGRQYTPEGYTQSNALHQQALAIDPGYAPAWRGLAVNYGNEALDGLRPAEEANRLAKEAVEKALAADPDFALAHSTLGTIAMNFQRDYTSAARHMSHALALDPTDLNLLANAANLLASLGRTEQAIRVGRYIVERDPVNPVIFANMGGHLLAAGQLDEAIAACRTALSLSPGYIGAESTIGVALLLKGDKPCALAATQREAGVALRLGGTAVVQHALGNAAAADAALAELIAQHGSTQRGLIADALAMRGDLDGAFAWIERARAASDPSINGIARDRLLDNLHADPRWQPLLNALGEAPEQLAAIPFEVELPAAGP